MILKGYVMAFSFIYVNFIFEKSVFFTANVVWQKAPSTVIPMQLSWQCSAVELSQAPIRIIEIKNASKLQL